jgi:dihydroorotate dehydrogenase
MLAGPAAGHAAEWAWCNGLVSDPIELAGLSFPNRVGLAAGLDKNARCIDGLGAMGFGFVEVGTVTPKPQPGNPKPRMFRLPQARALINRLGFNNDGLDAFVANVQARQLSLAKGPHSGPEHRQERRHTDRNATARLPDLPGRRVPACRLRHRQHQLSPNTKNLRALQSDEALDALLGAIAGRGRNWPASTAARAGVCEDRARPGRSPGRCHRRHAARHGMDGVVATNTTIAGTPFRACPMPRKPAA